MGFLTSIKTRFAWWRWFLFDQPFRPGDPALGRTREMRNRNIRLMIARKYEREPPRC